MPIVQKRMIDLLEEAEKWREYALILRDRIPSEKTKPTPPFLTILRERWHVDRTSSRNEREKERLRKKRSQLVKD